MLNPHSFSGFDGKTPAISAWMYYSFVTLTTLGYGDIVPTRPVAWSLAVAEALTGQLYLTVLLARPYRAASWRWRESILNYQAPFRFTGGGHRESHWGVSFGLAMVLLTKGIQTCFHHSHTLLHHLSDRARRLIREKIGDPYNAGLAISARENLGRPIVVR